MLVYQCYQHTSCYTVYNSLFSILLENKLFAINPYKWIDNC